MDNSPAENSPRERLMRFFDLHPGNWVLLVGVLMLAWADHCYRDGSSWAPELFGATIAAALGIWVDYRRLSKPVAKSERPSVLPGLLRLVLLWIALGVLFWLAFLLMVRLHTQGFGWAADRAADATFIGYLVYCLAYGVIYVLRALRQQNSTEN